jgi:hypothetical protein
MRRMTVDLTDETLERIKEIQKMYDDIDIDVIVAVAIKRFLDTERESTLLDVLDDDSHETM